MQDNRRDAAEAAEDGGGRDEEYEINSMGEPSSTGLLEMVAMVSQHTKTEERGDGYLFRRKRN